MTAEGIPRSSLRSNCYTDAILLWYQSEIMSVLWYFMDNCCLGIQFLVKLCCRLPSTKVYHALYLFFLSCFDLVQSHTTREDLSNVLGSADKHKNSSGFWSQFLLIRPFGSWVQCHCSRTYNELQPKTMIMLKKRVSLMLKHQQNKDTEEIKDKEQKST